MALNFTLMLILVSIEVFFSSKQLSLIQSGTPDTSILLILPYCSSLFCLISKELNLLSKLLTFFFKRSFLTRRFLMITSFTFNIFFVSSSNGDSNFISKFVIFSDGATLVVEPELSLLPSTALLFSFVSV